MKIIIESGKFYLKIQEDFIVDAISFNPQRPDYILFETNNLPEDILIGCYKLVGNQIVLDEEKHKLFIEKQEAFAKQFAGDEDV
jgi:hypothetical protein